MAPDAGYPQGVGPWPLIGRDAELRLLQSRFEQDPRGSIVSGEAGIGKTRLLREVARSWTDRGGLAEFVIGTAAAKSISLGATAQLVPPTFGISEMHELLHNAVGELEVRMDQQPVALFVDDAQFLDDTSAVLVHLVATRSRVPIFIGVRAGTTPPDPITSLWKDQLLPRLELEPFDEAHTMELLKAVVPDLSAEARRRLFRLSQGNALFLHELVALAVDESGSADVAAPAAIAWREGPAARLRELIDTRMGILAPELFDALELIAVSEPLPGALADRLTGGRALEELEGRTLIEVGQDGLLRTAHPLHGEAIRGSMGALRRRSLLRQLTAAAEPSDGLDAIRLASWRMEAGERDPALFATAGRAALRHLDYPLAEQLSRVACDGADAAQTFDAGLTLGTALMGQGRGEEADAALRALRPSDEAAVVRAATTRATNLFRRLGRPDDALATLADVEASISDPAWLAECRTVRAMLLVILWQAGRALEIAEPLVDDPDIREPARLRAVFVTATVWMHGGQTQRALDLIGAWLARTRAWRQYAPLVEIQLAFVRFYTLALAGRLAEANRFAEAQFDLDHPHPAPALRAVFALARGAAATIQGRHRDALAALEQAGDGLPGSDWFYNQEILRHALLERATLLAGDIARARQLAAARQDTVGHDLVALYERPLCDAWIEVADGGITNAAADLTQAAERARPFSPLLAAALYREVAGLGHGERVLDAVRSLAVELDHPLTALCHAEVLGLVHADAAALEQVADRYEQLGHLLWAAEVYAHAARAYTAAGRIGASLGASERSARLRDGCGQPHSAALSLVGDSAGGQLTRREREVALLAARYASNADLAARLQVSVHTVHTHLTRIYRKLGVADREELAAHLGPRR